MDTSNKEEEKRQLYKNSESDSNGSNTKSGVDVWKRDRIPGLNIYQGGPAIMDKPAEPTAARTKSKFSKT